jgi:hypothetical protein
MSSVPNSVSNDRIVNNLRAQVFCLDLQSIVKGDQPPLLLLPDVERVVQKLNNRGTCTYLFVPDVFNSVGYSIDDVHALCDMLRIPYHRVCRYPDWSGSGLAAEKRLKMKQVVLSLKTSLGYSIPIVTCLTDGYEFEPGNHPVRVPSNMAKLGEFSESDLARTLAKADDTEDLIFNVMCKPNGGTVTNTSVNWGITSYGELLLRL